MPYLSTILHILLNILYTLEFSYLIYHPLYFMIPTPFSLSLINQFKCLISDETNFSIVGDVEVTRGNHVWSIPEWSEDFRIEFDIIVDMEFSSDWTNAFRVTITDDNSGNFGDRIAALFVRGGGTKRHSI